MIGVRIQDDATKTLRGIAAGLPDALRSGVLRAAQFATGHIRRTVYSLFSVRTGSLARSYKESFLGYTNNTASAGSFSDLEYAGIQERGGIVRPRTGKNLAIPLKRMAVGKWPRHFAKGELVFIKSRRGNKLLARVKKGGGIEPMFVLKPQVQLHGRKYLDAARDAATPDIEAALFDATDATASKAGA